MTRQRRLVADRSFVVGEEEERKRGGAATLKRREKESVRFG